MADSRAEQLKLALGTFADADASSLMADLAELWQAKRTGLEQANEAQTEEV